MDGTKIQKNPIQVAERIFQVVEYLAAYGAANLLQISTGVCLHKATVHRILASLSWMGYVKQDENTLQYRLTIKIWRIANQTLSRIEMIDIVRPYLKQLMAATGETVHLVQMDGTDAVYVLKEEAYQNPVRLVSQIGKSIPLYCSGVGKALLAEMEDVRIGELWGKSEIIAYTENTVTDYNEFMKEIAVIRKKGYAIDREEHEPGICCIAVALRQQGTEAMYAFSISAPAARLHIERIKELQKELLRVKKELSEER